MSVSSISGPVPSPPTVTQSNQKFLWSQVGSSLKSGDLTGAQTAFGTLTRNYERGKADGTTGTGLKTAPGATPLRSDVEQLAQALKSGNLSGAQSAFTQLSQDAKAAGIGTGPTPSPPSTSTDGTSTGISVLA